MDLLETNHEISRHFTRRGAYTSSTSDHPTQTIPPQKGTGYHESKVCKFKGRKSEIILVGMTKIILMNGALTWRRSCRSPLGHMRFSVHNGGVSTFSLALRRYSKFNHLLRFIRARRKGGSNRRNIWAIDCASYVLDKQTFACVSRAA